MSSREKSWSVTSPLRHSTVWTPVVPMRAVCSLRLDGTCRGRRVRCVSLRLAGDDDGDAHPPAARRSTRTPSTRPGGPGGAQLLLALPRVAVARASTARPPPPTGSAAHEAHLGRPVCGAGRPADRRHVGRRRGLALRPGARRRATRTSTSTRSLAAARAAMPAWRDAGPQVRAGGLPRDPRRGQRPRLRARQRRACTRRGQPFVMAFQAGGPHAQDRAARGDRRPGSSSRSACPTSVIWEKPGRQDGADPDGEGLPDRAARRRAGHRLQHLPDVELLPRALRLAGHRQPGHRQAAPARGAAARDHRRGRAEVLRGGRLRPGPGAAGRRGRRRGPGQDARRAPRGRDHRLHRRPAASATGWSARAPRAAQLVFTEKAGVNTVVVDSTDDLRGALGNLAFSLALYSGQMCTAPQNVYVPADGIDTDEGHLSFEEVGDRLGGGDRQAHRRRRPAVELLGATVNDQVRGNAAGVARAGRARRRSGGARPRGR